MERYYHHKERFKDFPGHPFLPTLPHFAFTVGGGIHYYILDEGSLVASHTGEIR